MLNLINTALIGTTLLMACSQHIVC